MNRKLLLIIISFIFFLVIALLAIVDFSRNAIPKITNKSKNELQRKVIIDEPVKVIFNRNLNQDQKEYVEIKSNSIKPKVTYSIEGKTLLVTPDKNFPFTPSTNYQLLITPLSQSGKKGELLNLGFTTENVAESELPAALKEELIRSTDLLEDGKVKGHEIFRYLPYENESFKIMAEPQKDGVNIKYYVNLKGNLTISKNSLFTWIRSKGSDPNNLLIVYE